MDGTFKSCPHLFSQVYIINGYYRGECLPMAFALMSKKSAPSYEKVFRALKLAVMEIHPAGLQPRNIITDFESAIIAAIPTEFANAHHYGCFFHYTQAMLKWIRTNGYFLQLRENEQFGKNFTLKLMLPFLPSGMIVNGSQLIDAEHQCPKDFSAYFESYWAPKASMISCFERMNHRTNNASKGYNSGFNKNFTAVSRNVWAFVKKIQTEEEYALIRQNRLDEGHPPATSNNFFQRRDASLVDWKNSFDPNDILFELRRVSRIMRR